MVPSAEVAPLEAVLEEEDGGAGAAGGGDDLERHPLEASAGERGRRHGLAAVLDPKVRSRDDHAGAPHLEQTRGDRAAAVRPDQRQRAVDRDRFPVGLRREAALAERRILETTFLGDLERELGRGEAGPAQRFLEANPEAGLCVTFTIAGEIAAGSSLGERSAYERFLAPFRILGWTPEVSWRHGQLHRYLAEQGLLIGSNDLWIAATAIAHGIPLVTANDRHFARAPDLDVRRYR